MPLDEDGNPKPCYFCDDPDCDGSGYNCEDGRYQEYNLRGWPDNTDEQPDDAWQQFKDDVVMGYIDRDGNQLEPPEPVWAERDGAR
jgi:hypothetical protein